MNANEGKMCPYCMALIREDDDTAVCVKCRMRIRKDCRTGNSGDIVYDRDRTGQGTIQTLQGSSQDIPFAADLTGHEESGHSILEYVDSNTDYYSRLVKKIERGRALPMNWPAALFGVAWMVYRKMYIRALLLFCLLEGVGMLYSIFKRWEMPYALDSIQYANVFIRFVIGAEASNMYFGKLGKCRKKEQKLPAEKREAYFIRHKGTNTAGMILAVIFVYAVPFAFTVYRMIHIWR